MEINEKDFKHKVDTMSYVEYTLYKDNYESLRVVYPLIENSEIHNVLCEKGEACFWKIPSSISSDNYNRMLFFPDMYRIKDLGEDVMVWWIEESIKAKTLPDYTKITKIDDMYIFQLKLDEPIPISLLYVYLCTLRALQEERGIIRSTKILMEKYGIDYYTSFVIASRHRGYADNHTFLGLTSDYIVTKIENVLVPARTIIALKRYIENPTEYDKRILFENGQFNKELRKGINFRATTTILSVYGDTDVYINIQDIFTEEFNQFLKEDGSKESIKGLVSLKNKNTGVKQCSKHS